MRALLRLGRDKSALSNIVAYVLLISITVALSVMVYGWLRFIPGGGDIEECPDGVNIIIKDYQCYESVGGGDGGRLIVTLKNKGRFTVDGYVVRVHNRTGASFGFYLFDESGVEIKPGVEYTEIYNFSDTSFQVLNDDAAALKTVTFLEVQPFMTDDGKVSCKSYSSQKIDCK